MRGMNIFKRLTNWLKHPIKAAVNVVADTVAESVTDTSISPDRSDMSLTEMVPYDEHLLERSLTHWQFGDWGMLAKLERDVLRHHPDRAKLALLVAAGHQQLGNVTATRQLAGLAQDWGCSKKLISQVLIAGVHNTLGRASAIEGSQSRSLGHFEKAIAIASPGADTLLLIQARARGELEQLGLPGLSDSLSSSREITSPLHAHELNKSMQHLAEQVQKNNTELVDQIKKQNSEFVSIRKQLETTIKKEMLNATQQVEAFLGIQNFLNNGERIPGMHGWPVSPDFALYLIELIDSNDYDLIIEFGSGTSTILIAKTLARIKPKRNNKPATIQAAFEHLENYYTQTLSRLEESDLSSEVKLLLSPLKPYLAAHESTYQYYHCDEALGELRNIDKGKKLNILLVVDGPPASTGKHARYPAVPATLKFFSDCNIDILLDDYIRDDEKEIVQLWLKDISLLNLYAQTFTKKMEKDACFIQIRSQPQQLSH